MLPVFHIFHHLFIGILFNQPTDIHPFSIIPYPHVLLFDFMIHLFITSFYYFILLLHLLFHFIVLFCFIIFFLLFHFFFCYLFIFFISYFIYCYINIISICCLFDNIKKTLALCLCIPWHCGLSAQKKITNLFLQLNFYNEPTCTYQKVLEIVRKIQSHLHAHPPFHSPSLSPPPPI